METAEKFAQDYDEREQERIWEKVSPEMRPFPPRRKKAEEAESRTCCMGNEADVPRLVSFLREEQASLRAERVLANRTGTPAARRHFARFAKEREARIRRIRAALFLITGESAYPEPRSAAMLPVRRSTWEALRERYHAEACDGFNYGRAADETEDLCLRSLYAGLSEESYSHAEEIETLLAEML